MQGLRDSPKTSSPSTEMEACDKEEGFLPPARSTSFMPPEGSIADPVLQTLARTQHTQMRGIEPEAISTLVGFIPPPSSCTRQGCDAQIQMVQGSESAVQGLATGLVHPLLTGVLGHKPVLENKHQGGWRTFMRQWDQHMQFVLACNKGMIPPDSLLLEALRVSLDKADQNLLEYRREQNPGLSFQAFWDELQSLYDRDTVAQSRMAWEAVKLPPGDLSLEKWLEFLGEFQLKRDRVEDRTPNEEYQLLLRGLPNLWQKEIIKEEAKRGKGKWLVRMTNIPPKSPLQLKHLVEDATGMEILTVQPTVNGVTVVCPTMEAQKAVMGLAGHTLGGLLVKCSRADSTMSGEDICDFVTQRLQTEHRWLSLQQTWGMGPKSRQVAAVHNEHMGNQEGKGKDRRPNSPQGKGQPGKKGIKGNKFTPPPSPNTPNPPPPPSRNSRPQRDFGKGSSRGKGEGKGNTYTNPPPELCGFCLMEGRSHNHKFQTCTYWLDAKRTLDRVKTCLACRDLGRPCQHPFYSCPTWLAARAEKWQNSPSGSQRRPTPPPPRPGSPQRHAPEGDQRRNTPVPPRTGDNNPGSPFRGKGAPGSR